MAAERDSGRHVFTRTRDHQRARVAGRAAIGSGRGKVLGPVDPVMAEPGALEREGHLGGQIGGEAEEGVHRVRWRQSNGR